MMENARNLKICIRVSIWWKMFRSNADYLWIFYFTFKIGSSSKAWSGDDEISETNSFFVPLCWYEINFSMIHESLRTVVYAERQFILCFCSISSISSRIENIITMLILFCALHSVPIARSFHFFLLGTIKISVSYFFCKKMKMEPLKNMNVKKSEKSYFFRSKSKWNDRKILTLKKHENVNRKIWSFLLNILWENENRLLENPTENTSTNVRK